MPDTGRHRSVTFSPRPFAYGLCFHKLFWVFFIGSFLGVVVETLWVLITRFEWVNRTGLVYGPFNPIYGFGAVLMTLTLIRLANRRDLWIFLAGGVLGGVYEYLCSWAQEFAFGSVSWEYSHMRYNLQGRINLLYTMFWGILALIWVKELYPRISRKIERIPPRVGRPLTWILVAFMIVNMLVSAGAVLRWSQRQSGIASATSVTQFFDQRFPDDRMRRIYPSLQFV